MKVSRIGYYEWLNHPISNRDKENKKLSDIIKEVFIQGRNCYGTRRIAKKLAQNDIIISKRRIGKLMISAGLYCKTKRRFKVTTDSKHNNPISPNLLERQFAVQNPDQYWVGDITYITTKKGLLYLATVIDLYSRQIIGWSMADNMKAKLVNDGNLEEKAKKRLDLAF
jgi:transposase InsO family protein